MPALVAAPTMASFNHLPLEVSVMIVKLCFWNIFYIADATCDKDWSPSAVFWASSCKKLCALAIVSPSSLSAVRFVLESLHHLPLTQTIRFGGQSDEIKRELPWSRALWLPAFSTLYTSLCHAQLRFRLMQTSKAVAHLVSCMTLMKMQETYYRIEGIYGNWPEPDAIMVEFKQARLAMRALQDIMATDLCGDDVGAAAKRDTFALIEGGPGWVKMCEKRKRNRRRRRAAPRQDPLTPVLVQSSEP